MGVFLLVQVPSEEITQVCTWLTGNCSTGRTTSISLKWPNTFHNTAYFKLHVQGLILHFVPRLRIWVGCSLCRWQRNTLFHLSGKQNLLSCKSYFKSWISHFGRDTVLQMSLSVPLTSSPKMIKQWKWSLGCPKPCNSCPPRKLPGLGHRDSNNQQEGFLQLTW